MHRGLLLLLVLFTCWAWYPIVHWVWDHHPLRLGVSTGDATDLSYRLFHEAGCRGESFALTGAADLCGRAYPSGGHSNPDSQPPPPLSLTHTLATRRVGTQSSTWAAASPVDAGLPTPTPPSHKTTTRQPPPPQERR